MNELIEELWFGSDYEKRKDFEQAIQTACKAQRNACAKAYVNANFDFDAGGDILNAEITKEDYE